MRSRPHHVSRRRTAAALALALVLAPRAAAAHDQPYSTLELRLSSGGLEGRVLAHVVDLAHEARLAAPDSLLDPEYAGSRLEALHGALERRLILTADGRRVRPRWTSLEALPERRQLAFGWRSDLPPVGVIQVSGPLFPYDPLHETYLNVYEGGRLRMEGLLDHARPHADYWSGSRQGVLAVVRTFVAQGAHHIFIGPDHILFIVALLLLGGGLRRLLRIVTAFTIAHSLTLALATLQIVNPPPRVTEPAIALSIVLVGIENLFAFGGARPGSAGPVGEVRRDLRTRLAFTFGLLHGFGFAGVLREFGLPRGSLAWSLLSFNLGVEIGQACIVLAVTPALALLRARDPGVARRVALAGSAAVIAAGGYWFLQRLFFAV